MKKLATTISLFIILPALSLMTGCASAPKTLDLASQKPYQANPAYSYAKNLAIASGLDEGHLFDAKLTPKQLAELNGSVGTIYRGGTTMSSTLIGATAAAFSDPAGFGRGPAAILDILASLGIHESPERASYYFGWVRADLKTPHQTATTINDLITKSLKKELDGRGQTYSTFQKNFGKVLFSGFTICQSSKPILGDCFIGSSTAVGDPPKPFGGEFFGGIEAKTPVFLGKGTAHFVRGGLIDRPIVSGMKIDDFASLDLWLSISKEMPENVFFYLAPGKYSYKLDDGKIVYGSAPIVLDHGKVHYFAVAKNIHAVKK
jgi:hypothetical protein